MKRRAIADVAIAVVVAAVVGGVIVSSLGASAQPAVPDPVRDRRQLVGNGIYFSLESDGTVDGLSVTNEDIVYFDGAAFSLYFDGSAEALSSSLIIDAFAFRDDGSILMSFAAPGSIPGIPGTTTDSDIVLFDPVSNTFALYFDGSDVGLTTTSEDVDAVELLPDGRLLISTLSSVTVDAVSGEDTDILAFTPTSLGSTTAGTWDMYFDGSDVGLTESTEDVDAVAVDTEGNIYLSTVGQFSTNGLSGDDEDVFVFTPSSTGSDTSGTFASTLFFDGSSHGLTNEDLSGIELPTAIVTPTSTATPAATETPTETPTTTTTATSTPTVTDTPTNTPTSTPTSMPADTPTSTPEPAAPVATAIERIRQLVDRACNGPSPNPHQCEALQRVLEVLERVSSKQAGR
jgi:hypothetical protein